MPSQTGRRRNPPTIPAPGVGLAGSQPSRAASVRGPEGLAGLTDGQILHGFTARALFAAPSGRPLGARFVHATGVPVDVLFFDSVPQVSIAVSSPPVSERGEPHALEHLVLGKGRSGKHLAALLGMRLATGSAATYRDITQYQFRTSAGADGFYELLARHLETLVKPDFTDEEIRREVAHLEAVASEGGRLTLAEKGTVYNEMISASAQPSWRVWSEAARLACGSDHPLAREAGGEPAGLRQLDPTAVRSFHAAHYRVGPGIQLTAALPATWSAAGFLERLDVLLGRLAPADAAAPPPPLPPFRPAEQPEIRIGAYPADSADAPQDVVLAWRALPALSVEEWDALEILMRVVGEGEASYLHRDLVDQRTRALGSGPTSVDAGFSPAWPFPRVWLGGLPVSQVDPARLSALREVVVQRFRRLAALPDGSAELAEAAAKARARMAASRRAFARFVDSPPNFGARPAGRAWHDRLLLCARSPGFVKPVAPDAAYERLEAEFSAGRNPWSDLVARVGLAERPHVTAVRPDPALAGATRIETEARLARHERGLAARLGGGDAQKGLAAFRAAYDARSAELEARDRTVPRPGFLEDPPLTRDDAPFQECRLGTGAPLVRVHFASSAFTDVALAFDLRGLTPEEMALLPLLAADLSGTGVTTADGERLDYVQVGERRDLEIDSFSVNTLGNPVTGRHELEVLASASSTGEVPQALAWMENHVLRPRAGPDLRGRMVDLCQRDLQRYRTALEGAEEDWAYGLALAFRHQDDALHLALSSVFTRLRLLTRLRWRLEDPPPGARARLEDALASLAGLLASGPRRAEVEARLSTVDGELGETLRYEAVGLPAERWREDLAEVARDLREDLGVGSARVLEGLAALRKRVLVRARARARITARPDHADAAARLLDELLAKLPEGESAGPPRKAAFPVHERLEQRYGPLPRPTHVGFVQRASTTGVHVHTARGPSYGSRAPEDGLDALALNVFAGAAPHSFFMKTWSAGLAYGNGIRWTASAGRVLYYADRCSDLAGTMRFVAGLASATALEDPFLLEHALAGAFDDFRGADDFRSRGAALAADLADGIRPEAVAAFKRLLLAAAEHPEALARVKERLPGAVGRVLVGFGPRTADTPEALRFVIGPEALLVRYEAYLREQGEAERLVRIYPRDFWPLREGAAVP